MPEGPEIRRSRDELTSLLKNRRVTKVWFAFDALQPYQAILKNQRVSAVQSKGKAILIRFSNNHILYSHNQLYGRWFVSPDGQEPDTTRQLRVAIHVNKGAAFLYSASDIEVLQEHELAYHPYLKNWDWNYYPGRQLTQW